MTPSADPTNAAAEADTATLVPSKLLEGGEIVLLAVKPSGWFVLLVSWKVLIVAGLVGLVTVLVQESFGAGPLREGVLLICVGIGCVRVIAGCFQWVGRLYVLTNRRLMRIRGVMRVDVFTCALNRIREVTVTSGALEAALGVGTVHFTLADTEDGEGRWVHVARPVDVQELIRDAIRRAR